MKESVNNFVIIGNIDTIDIVTLTGWKIRKVLNYFF